MIRYGMVGLLLAAVTTSAQSQDTVQGDIPPGMGTLSQDDIAITMRLEELEIRAVPLDERLFRLLTPDNYRSLHDLVQQRAIQIDSVSRLSGVSAPGLLLVTFFGRRQGARYDPQNVTITVRNQLWRPIGQVPYSNNFNSQQLDTRQQATGIILFEEPIPVFEPFTVSYLSGGTDAWEGKLTKIQRERSRVLGRLSDSTRTRTDSTRQ